MRGQHVVRSAQIFVVAAGQAVHGDIAQPYLVRDNNGILFKIANECRQNSLPLVFHLVVKEVIHPHSHTIEQYILAGHSCFISISENIT